MKWFLNLTTKSKLFFGFGLIIILLAIIIYSSYNGITTIQESQKKIYEEDFNSAVNLWKIRTDLNGIRAVVLDMMMVTKKSDQETWNQEIKDRDESIKESLQILLNRYRSESQFFQKLEELRLLYDAYKQTRDSEVIPLINSNKLEEARKILLGVQLERYKRIRNLGEELGNQAAKNAQTDIDLSEQKAGNAVMLFGAIGIVSIVMSIIMIFFLNRIIALPLKETANAAERISLGDLTTAISSNNRSDEVGSLTKSFIKMIENLRSVTKEISEGVNVLGSSASEILASTTQVASSASETATAVSQTTATVEEVKQTSQIVSQKAKYVTDASQKATQAALIGKKSVEELINGMNKIREQMESVAESIFKLSEQSQAVGEIIATVNDLADQSNLLAVNAAIEAAKAGEQGKGFTVVAQEIKNLAEQSKQATTQVRTILSDVQKSISAAVMVTEQGTKSVEAGVKQTNEAGESIGVLSNSISEAAQAATQIAASSQQQSVGMDQVALAMENIKQASSQNVAGTRQTEVAAENLHTLGLKLKELVQRYKL